MYPERVVERVMTRWEQIGDCWISTYSTGSHGYAQVGWSANGGNVTTVAHRVAWWAAHRTTIPEGLVVDHICHVRKCIRPDHLRLLPLPVNSALQSNQWRKTQQPNGELCKFGHQRVVSSKGHSKCRECTNRKRRELNALKKETP